MTTTDGQKRAQEEHAKAEEKSAEAAAALARIEWERAQYEKKQHIYEQFLHCLDREENLINFRITWGVQGMALLVAALAGVSQTKLALFALVYYPLALLIIVLGLVLTLLMGSAVNAAHDQVEYLIKQTCVRLELITVNQSPYSEDKNIWLRIWEDFKGDLERSAVKFRISGPPPAGKNDKDAACIWKGSEFLRPYGELTNQHLKARLISRYLPVVCLVFWLVALIWLGATYVADHDKMQQDAAQQPPAGTVSKKPAEQPAAAPTAAPAKSAASTSAKPAQPTPAPTSAPAKSAAPTSAPSAAPASSQADAPSASAPPAKQPGPANKTKPPK